MPLMLILFPAAAALLSLAVRSNLLRPFMLPFTATAHFVMVIIQISLPDNSDGSEWIFLDPAGRIVLLAVSGLFLFCSFYCAGYLRYRQERSNRVFVFCLLLFPGVVSLVTLAQHLGLMWVAIEATTLSTAPLVYFNRSRRSIEATWKYLLVSSVGIALALLGTFFLAYSSMQAGLVPSLMLGELLGNAASLSQPWLRAAFILLLIGYGTKMGLAPMHTWKPDAYGEAPGVVGAILSGGVTSCAFLAFLRIYHICSAAGQGPYISGLLLFTGLFSMVVAAIFMLGQKDFKRMLAYSSVEHMGILITGLGIGGPALFGTVFHIISNCITKGVLFLSAGNIHRAYGSKTTDSVRGAMKRLPLSGSLFMASFLAVTGSPPFAPFISEFSILKGAMNSGHQAVAFLFLAFLLLIFTGMLRTVLKVLQGETPDQARETPYRDGLLTGMAVLLLMILVLLLGLYIPGPLKAMLDEAVIFLGVQP